LFYEKPLQIPRGQSVWFYDADGTRRILGINWAKDPQTTPMSGRPVTQVMGYRR